MPYIKEKDRDYAVNMGAENPGDLNFLFTHEIKKYMNLKGVSYRTINDVIGALEGAKLEFYRRVAAPYEDQKIQENGDVY
jgi:predicted DNA-binding protein with PD1-like motif